VAAEAAEIQLTPVTRSPFPERGYVVDLRANAQIAHGQVHVSENGRPIRNFTFLPAVDASAARFGVVLVIDASDSMRGKPYRAALAAARAFVAHSQPNEKIGVVAFNRVPTVVAVPTNDSRIVMKKLDRPPPLAHGTQIYDAVAQALTLLRRADVLSGSVVVLSDGADTGSSASEESVAAQARRAHVRVFGVGLHSGAFDGQPLQALASDTGATYAEASSTAALARIYHDLGVRLASEYLLEYRSTVSPATQVQVTVAIEGIGEATAAYVAPKPAGLGPFHRSLLDRFWGSALAPFVIVLLAAALLGVAPVMVLRGPRNDLLERLSGFVSIGKPKEERPQRKALTGALLAGTERSLANTRWWTRFAEELEIAGVGIPPAQILVGTAVVAFLVGLVLSLIAPIFGLFGLGVFFAVRTMIAKKLDGVRDAFAEQLPDTLQVLASALRAGHSFVGALTVVVKDSPEPTRRELQKVVADDQLGVPPEESLREVARRMSSDDLEQVAIVAELQREAGGNMAEVLDTVVETIRERFDLRRLIQTLTAQGRLARWVVSLLPVAVALAVTLINPEYMRPLFTSTGGQILIAICAVMIICGSLIIKKIINIKV
jgi:tight adherence protein B